MCYVSTVVELGKSELCISRYRDRYHDVNTLCNFGPPCSRACEACLTLVVIRGCVMQRPTSAGWMGYLIAVLASGNLGSVAACDGCTQKNTGFTAVRAVAKYLRTMKVTPKERQVNRSMSQGESENAVKSWVLQYVDSETMTG